MNIFFRSVSIRAAVVAIACLGVGACVPVLSTYYSPAASSGVVMDRGPCSSDKVKDIFLRPAPDLKMHIFALGPPEKARAEVFVRLSLAASRSAKVSNDFVVVTGPQISGQHVKIEEIETITPRSSQGEYRDSVKKERPTEMAYAFSFLVPTAQPEEFTVSLPALLIDDKPVEVPDVHFKRTRDVHLVFLCQ